MGRLHSHAYANVVTHFPDLQVAPRLVAAAAPRAEYVVEVYGTQGSVRWNFERFNELEVRIGDGGTAVFCLWVVNAIIGWTFPVMIEGLGGGLTYTVYGIINLVVAVVLYRIMPETSGKSLEEIEKEMEERFS